VTTDPKELVAEFEHIVESLKKAIDARTTRLTELNEENKSWAGDIDPFDYQDAMGRSVLGDMYVSYTQAYLALLNLRAVIDKT